MPDAPWPRKTCTMRRTLPRAWHAGTAVRVTRWSPRPMAGAPTHPQTPEHGYRPSRAPRTPPPSEPPAGSARPRSRVVLLGTVVATPAVAAPAPMPARPSTALSVDPTPTPTPAPPEPTPTPAPTAAPTPSPTPVANVDPGADGNPRPDGHPGTHPHADRRPRRPTPHPTPSWPTTITTLGSSVRFYGSGWGHGVGLNQYGARGRANAGQTGGADPRRVLQGLDASARSAPPGPSASSSSAPTPPRPPPRWCSSAAAARGGSAPRRIACSRPRRPSGRGARRGPSTARSPRSGGSACSRATGRSCSGPSRPRRVPPVVTPIGAGTTLEVTSRTSSYDLYRGSLTLRLAASSVSVINTVGMDTYLRGVVPVEMPASWPRQALRAQAIAARSYAAYHLRPAQPWDVYDDTRSQVYRGREGEQAATDQRDRRRSRGRRALRDGARERGLPLDRRRRDGAQRVRLRDHERGARARRSRTCGASRTARPRWRRRRRTTRHRRTTGGRRAS